MPNPIAIRRLVPGAGATIAFAVLIGWAAPAAAEDNSPAIAESPRGRITLAEYEAEMAKLAPPARAQFAANRTRLVQLLNSLYLNRTVANDARAAGLDRDPVVAHQIALLIDKTLAQIWIAKVEEKAAAAFDADPGKYVARAREIYLSDMEKYKTPEKVRVFHVLVKVGPEGDAAARKRAEALRAKIAAGTPIADVARDESDDPTAKGTGGDLGFFTAKDFDPEFTAAAFALTRRGELAPVTKTKFGYHVIEFQERKPAVQRSFDEVKQEILADVRRSWIETERTKYQGSMFTDPPPKVNEELISKINADARATATLIEGTTKPAR
jgi:peptidyl-prolyl cis-trans isomerase C